MAIRAGSTLWLRESPSSKGHMWFVLTNPFGDPQCIIAVMVRSKKTFTDNTVMFRVGDHPFIKHDSVLNYPGSKKFKLDALNRALIDGSCHERDDQTEAILARARNGLLDSARTPKHIYLICERLFG